MLYIFKIINNTCNSIISICNNNSNNNSNSIGKSIGKSIGNSNNNSNSIFYFISNNDYKGIIVYYSVNICI